MVLLGSPCVAGLVRGHTAELDLMPVTALVLPVVAETIRSHPEIVHQVIGKITIKGKIVPIRQMGGDACPVVTPSALAISIP